MPTVARPWSLPPLLFLAANASSQAPIVVNEFRYGDTSTDDREFVELFNSTGVPIDISGWTIACSDAGGANPSYVVQPGSIVFPGGYFVLGSALVPGANQVIGATNLFENDEEAIRLRDRVVRQRPQDGELRDEPRAVPEPWRDHSIRAARPLDR